MSVYSSGVDRGIWSHLFPEPKLAKSLHVHLMANVTLHSVWSFCHLPCQPTFHRLSPNVWLHPKDLVYAEAVNNRKDNICEWSDVIKTQGLTARKGGRQIRWTTGLTHWHPCASDSLATYGAIEMCFGWLIDWSIRVQNMTIRRIRCIVTIDCHVVDTSDRITGDPRATPPLNSAASPLRLC